jgi:hypothetical protein
MRGWNDGVMVNHDNPIERRVHVQLNTIGSELDRAVECGERVLGMALVRPTVGDPLRRAEAWTRGQVFLLLVASSFVVDEREAMNASMRGQSALTAGGPERLPDEAP